MSDILSVDRVSVKGITIEKLLEKGLLEKLRGFFEGDVILAATLIITGKGPILLSHESSQDYENKIIKIDLPLERRHREEVIKALAIFKIRSKIINNHVKLLNYPFKGAEILTRNLSRRSVSVSRKIHRRKITR